MQRREHASRRISKKVAETIKLPGRRDPKADIPQLIEQWLCNVENGPWIFILKSADNAGVPFDTGHDDTDTRNITANADIETALWIYLP